jgi:hypothetical protein
VGAFFFYKVWQGSVICFLMSIRTLVQTPDSIQSKVKKQIWGQSQGHPTWISHNDLSVVVQPMLLVESPSWGVE